MLLGLALASFFKRSCKGKSCIIVKAPNPEVMTKGYYKFNNKCFKFNTNVTECAEGKGKNEGEKGGIVPN